MVSALLGVTLTLSACSTLPPARSPEPAATQAPVTRLSGRLAVQVAQDALRSFSAGFELVGNPEAGQLVMSTPLGTLLARATWRPGDVRLETPDGERSFMTLDDLAEATFQESIPLAALIDWLSGRPWTGAPSEPSSAPKIGFTQMRWTIDLSQQSEGLVVATRQTPAPAVSVRARLDRP